MQPSLFNQELIHILPYDGDAVLYNYFFSPQENEKHFNNLRSEVHWVQQPIKIFGKEVMQPRLTAWYGDSDKPYSYSGITMYPHAWTTTLNEIKRKIEHVAGTAFTGALLNLYRHGHDSMGWHRDNEKELGDAPVIGSVSFGATRTFQFRNYKTKKDLKSVELTDGSLLLMRGSTNHFWEHRLLKTNQPVKERINITFRVIY
jgi:alkylated DNA repair dioxygenase AlkB